MASKGARTRERILSEAEALVFAKGYSGTAVDDILAATSLTKGAFFYHFKTKNELAMALLERFWERDVVFFQQIIERARSLSDDPLQALLIFFRLFEEAMERGEGQPLKCLFASYLYEGEQFDERIHTFIRNGFDEWRRIFLSVIEPALAAHETRIEVSADELAEMIMGQIEGAFVLAQAGNDPDALIRASRYFRQHLQLLFKS
jgi:TetR/AcrR family transcriptional regulator, transcriptional repressor for nem operon